jgi:hypothetical protein
MHATMIAAHPAITDGYAFIHPFSFSLLMLVAQTFDISEQLLFVFCSGQTAGVKRRTG